MCGDVEAVGPQQSEVARRCNRCLFSPITEAIEALPLANTPEVFGLHLNAETGYYTQAARDMWSHLLELQPQTGKVPCRGLWSSDWGQRALAPSVASGSDSFRTVGALLRTRGTGCPSPALRCLALSKKCPDFRGIQHWH